MRAFTIAALIAFGSLTPIAAQTFTKDGKANTDLVTMSGCIAPAESKKGFTLTTTEMNEIYSLTGMNVKEFVNQRVEITGSSPSPKKLRIAGGLYPSANVAGQLGDMDPVKVAIATQSGPASNMPRPPIEFRVREVRVIPGTCPES